MTFSLDWQGNRAFLLLVILVLALAVLIRGYRLSQPPDYYFDEVYHAFTAAAYANNDPRGYEWWHQAPEGVAYEWLHPPVAKLFQGLSIRLLGDHSFAWRFPSLVFGILTVALTGYLAWILSHRNKLAVGLALLAASLDGLLIAQSRIAMNDIFVTTFLLVAASCYWHYWQAKDKQWWWLVSLSLGLAFASKWSGLFGIGLVYLIEMVRLGWSVRRQPLPLIAVLWAGLIVAPSAVIMVLLYLPELLSYQSSWVLVLVGLSLLVWWSLVSVASRSVKVSTRLILGLLVIPVASYLASFGQFWLQPRDNNLKTFVDLHYQIWWYQTNLEATHPWQSRPLEWLFLLKPVWFFVDYGSESKANIFAMSHPLIAWFGPLALLGLSFSWWKNKLAQWWYLLAWYPAVWLAWQLSPRIMFYYHYTPAIPFLVVALAILSAKWWSSDSKLIQTGVVGFWLIFVVVACYFLPFWTGLPVPLWLEQTYYWLPSWRPV